MKKLKLQMQTSLDGYVAGPTGEMDWLVWDWDDKLQSYVGDLTDSVDTILLGRNMTDGFISHWSHVAANPNDPSYGAGKKFIDIPKVVFSKTLRESPWVNTDLATGDLAEEVNRLKSKEGKDIIVYRGASFVSSLFKEGLIDEFYLFVNPVVLGKGMTIYGGVASKQALTLVDALPFECGIVLLHYELSGG